MMEYAMFGPYAPFYAIGLAIVLCLIGSKIIDLIQHNNEQK